MYRRNHILLRRSDETAVYYKWWNRSRELTLKCKLKCHVKPMKDPLSQHFNLHFRVNSLFHHLCSHCYAAQHSYAVYYSAVQPSCLQFWSQGTLFWRVLKAMQMIWTSVIKTKTKFLNSSAVRLFIYVHGSLFLGFFQLK